MLSEVLLMSLPSLYHANIGVGLPVALHMKVTLISCSWIVLFFGLVVNVGGAGRKENSMLI